jgi:glycosyltransferase involved in cell wall biosynthesis
MRRNRPRIDPDVSVVIPVVERFGDLKQIVHEFSAELARLQKTCEFIFVVDDSQRRAVPILRELQQSGGEISIVLLGGSFGESAALTIGLDRARGDVIITLAAYFQVEPRGLADALAALDEGADLVAGRRFPRIDSFFNRMQSSLFHGIVRRLTSTPFHDLSCGFKAMRRRVARELKLYGGMHRFIPVLALNRGFTVREVPMPQRREDSRTRFHGTAAYLGRLLDILTIFFLMKFTRTPLRFFGLLGVGLFSMGFLIDLLVAAQKIFLQMEISDRPALLLGVLLMVLGMQTLSLGLLGEIIIFTHARNIREYQVAEVLHGTSARPLPEEEPEIPAASAGRHPLDGALQAS